MGDLEDFYLGTPMLAKDYAYMHIPVAVLPTEILDHYNLHLLIHKGHVYVKIQCGMYGLPQAGKLANVQLQTFLAPHGYHLCLTTPGFWMHASCDIHFTLVMDDFAVRYMDQLNVDHLLMG